MFTYLNSIVWGVYMHVCAGPVCMPGSQSRMSSPIMSHPSFLRQALSLKLNQGWKPVGLSEPHSPCSDSFGVVDAHQVTPIFSHVCWRFELWSSCLDSKFSDPLSHLPNPCVCVRSRVCVCVCVKVSISHNSLVDEVSPW